MGWQGAQGSPHRFLFNGSFNANENLEQIPEEDLTLESRNINTHNGGAEPRGGTAIIGSAISGNPECLGIGQMENATGSRFLYFVGNDGTIYRNGSALTGAGTGLSTTARRILTPTAGLMFICSGVESVKVDTGSAIANISSASADWTGTSHPKQIVLHDRNASRRGFAFGVPGLGKNIYYSASGSLQDYAGAGSGTLVADFQDGAGASCGVELGQDLLALGRQETFFIDDSSSTVANWGVYRAPWRGGVAHAGLVISAANTVFCMMEDGNIYNLQRAQELRDVRLASITRPFYIHNWIRENVDLTKIAQFHCAWDPQIQAIKWFMVRLGQNQVDICLVYYPFENKWAPPHDGYDNDLSGYRASASCTVLESTGEYRLYTGDYTGRTWSLEEANKSDNGEAYQKVIGKPISDSKYPRNRKRYTTALLNYVSRGNYILTVEPIIDSFIQAVSSVNLSSDGAVLGTFELDADVLGGIGVAQGLVNIYAYGRTHRYLIKNSEAGDDFFLSSIDTDFADAGVFYA